MNDELQGEWKVRREAGLLPPLVTKEILDGRGWTRLARIPMGLFEVDGTTLRYRLWPVRDELEKGSDGKWHGRGLLFGREFCRFRLEPR